jgi:hypothetical protein
MGIRPDPQRKRRLDLSQARALPVGSTS